MTSPTLEHFYQKLEATSSYCYGIGDTPDRKHLSTEKFMQVCIEFNAACKLSSEHLEEVFGKQREAVISYLEHRLIETGNIYLKARYHHFLAVFNKDMRKMQEAFDCYFELLTGCDPTEDPEYTDNFRYLTGKCLEIALKFKNYLAALLGFLEGVLKNPLVHDRTKLEIVAKLKDAFVKVTPYSCLPLLTYQLAYRATVDGWKEQALSLSRHFVVKFPDQSSLKKRIWILSGDHEMNKAEARGNDHSNIVIAHQKGNYYEKAIAFYKEVSATEKMKSALREMEDNKKYLRFLRLGGSLPPKTIERFQLMIKATTNYLVTLPVNGLFDHLFKGHIHEWINEATKASSDTSSTFAQFFTNRQADINLNFKSKGAEHLGDSIQAKLKDDLIIEIYVEVLQRIVQEGSIRFEHLYRYISKQTCLTQPRTKMRASQVDYNWYSLIHDGLCSFLMAFSKMIEGKRSSYMLSIDSLIPKFEGILRDIVQLNGGQITKIDRNGDIVNRLLDELLADACLRASFSQADIALFKYTLTSHGLNIRNDAAHGFYAPQDYSLKKALKVLMCVFRLTKFRLSEEHTNEGEH